MNLLVHYFYNKVFIREYYCIKFKTRQEVILADLIVHIFVRLATMETKFELEGEDRFVIVTERDRLALKQPVFETSG